jgi:hypothetical protein
MISIGCVGIAVAEGIPLDPGMYIPKVVTTIDYSPVIVSAAEPGLYSASIIQPPLISDLSPQWFQTPALAQEPTRDISPVSPADTGSIPVNMAPFSLAPASLPVLVPSLNQTTNLFPNVPNNVDDQIRSIIRPSYTSLSDGFYSISPGSTTSNPSEINSEGNDDFNWAIMVVFDGEVSDEEARAIILSYPIPDTPHIGTNPGFLYYVVVSSGQERDSVLWTLESLRPGVRDIKVRYDDYIAIFFKVEPDEREQITRQLQSQGVPVREAHSMQIFYNRDQSDTVAKTIMNQLNQDSKVIFTEILYGWWCP